MKRIVKRILALVCFGCALALLIGLAIDLGDNVGSIGSANGKVVVEDALIGVIAVILVRWAFVWWRQPAAPPN